MFYYLLSTSIKFKINIENNFMYSVTNKCYAYDKL